MDQGYTEQQQRKVQAAASCHWLRAVASVVAAAAVAATGLAGQQARLQLACHPKQPAAAA